MARASCARRSGEGIKIPGEVGLDFTKESPHPSPDFSQICKWEAKDS